MDPSDLKNRKKIALYIRKVLISDNVEALPSYLGFIPGLIDSEDLQLNISRESFQDSGKHLVQITKHLTNKVLSLLKSVANNEPETYEKVWNHYSAAIKFGFKEDEGNKEKLAELLRFYTSFNAPKTGGKKDDKKFHLTSLAAYVERMKTGQKSIFYCMGPSSEEILKSPFAEGVLQRGYEIMLLDEPFDQFVLQTLNGYKDFKFQDISKGEISYGDEEGEKKSVEQYKEEFKPLMDWMLDLLKNEIDTVNISKKLTKTPLAVTCKDFGMSGYMMKVMAAQSGSKDNPYVNFLSGMKKTLEINPTHPVVVALNSQLKEGTEVNEDLKAMAKIMFDAAMISSGYDLKDSSSMLNTVDLVLRKALKLEVPVATEQQEQEEEEEAQSEDEVDEEPAEEEDASTKKEAEAHDEL